MELIAVVDARIPDRGAIDHHAIEPEQVDDPDPRRGPQEAAMMGRDAGVEDPHLAIGGGADQGQFSLDLPHGWLVGTVPELQEEPRQARGFRGLQGTSVRIDLGRGPRLAVSGVEPEPIGSDPDDSAGVPPIPPGDTHPPHTSRTGSRGPGRTGVRRRAGDRHDAG